MTVLPRRLQITKLRHLSMSSSAISDRSRPCRHVGCWMLNAEMLNNACCMLHAADNFGSSLTHDHRAFPHVSSEMLMIVFLSSSQPCLCCRRRGHSVGGRPVPVPVPEPVPVPVPSASASAGANASASAGASASASASAWHASASASASQGQQPPAPVPVPEAVVTVWIAPRSGHRWHMRRGCSGAIVSTTLAMAAREKYTPCKKCAI